jgi:hypothetical protein
MADLNNVAINKAIRTLPIHPRMNIDMYRLKDLFICSSNLAQQFVQLYGSYWYKHWKQKQLQSEYQSLSAAGQ